MGHLNGKFRYPPFRVFLLAHPQTRTFTFNFIPVPYQKNKIKHERSFVGLLNRCKNIVTLYRKSDNWGSAI